MRLQKSKDIIIHDESSGCVLLNMENGSFYGVHDLSLEIWKMLDDIFEAEQIVVRIAAKFKDIDKEEISNDVISFIAELKKEGLIKEYDDNN